MTIEVDYIEEVIPPPPPVDLTKLDKDVPLSADQLDKVDIS